MKRSAQVELFLLLSAAAALTECGQRRRCVDGNNMVVDDRYCSTAGSPSTYVYHWYYGGSGSRVGVRATGGSTTAPESGGTSHGVFGAAGEAHAGGSAGDGGAGGE